MTSCPSAFEILRTTRQLPVVEKEMSFSKRSINEASVYSTSCGAWGKSTRKWVTVTSSSSSSSTREFGDAMPQALCTVVAASYDVFMRTQTHHIGAKLNVECASREYRNALKTCIIAVENSLEMQKEEGKMNAEEERELMELLKVSLAIWHLCELLLLRGGARGTDKTLAYDLARWLQEHYCSTLLDKTESESERLKNEQKPEQDTVFWTTIQSFVMMGSGPSAWNLLASHSSYKSLFSRDAMSVTGASMKAAFQAVQKLLLTMPGRKNVNLNQNAPDEWKNWNDACEYLLNTDSHIKSNDGLKTLLQIMAGKEDVLKSCATNWYELMMARLFLDEPKPIAHRFQFLMTNCICAYNSDETRMGNFDCIILAIMEYDIQSALEGIIGLGFSWMAAHLADLLHKNNVIVADDLLPQAECSLRERLLLEYAMEIGASSGMWQFSVRYYEHCPKFGAIAIRSALEREPILTDHKAERLLAYCHGRKILTQTSRRITIERAQECKTKQAYASALQWLLRSNSLDDVDALCDEILKECNDRNSRTPLHEAVQFLELHPELARPEKLAWLVRYREFHVVLDDRESLRTQLRGGNSIITDSKEEDASLQCKLRFVSMEAAKRLDWLLSSINAPKVLQSDLLQQAERLLKESPTVFGSRHLYSLMAYLQQLDRSFDRHQFSESGSNKQLKERIESLISRNLAQAMLHEATASGCSAKTANGQSTALLLAQQPCLIADASFSPMEE
ncbi:unnamed protein product [Peronospora belbahrii]|uniref:Nuclear pore complex protein Nup85 n=1 Tax=Peronospora belbahrii TaxID=622444 RepID=A0AAU9LBZ4_9STRA|nr:unnamed protein product [Peronospora belbahrii]CAH0520975.1 unnamed protein product [Peronospora belbahrii]